jgi:carboxymethylenebutenolidase
MIDIAAADGGTFKGYLAVPDSGRGPGLLIEQEVFGINASLRAVADLYAEEGYVCLVPDLFWRMEPGVDLGYNEADFAKALDFYGRFDVDQGVVDIGDALKALRARPECTGKVAAMGFCLGGKLAYLTATRHDVDAAVSFYGVGIEESLDESSNISCPVLMHFAGADSYVPPEAVDAVKAHFAGNNDIKIHVYPAVDHAFYNLARKEVYHRPSAMMAHSRTISLLHDVMGPTHDLEALWDSHLDYEFTTRDMPKTMKTMVDEPYVNHVPTMTGGTGAKTLARFYQHHFIPQMPKDTSLTSISRTVGSDRVVDELLFSFTHDEEIDWMLPGIKPTGKKVTIPLVAIVNFRGDKLYHEHIYWDQASVLVQIGVLDPKGLPVAGVETAEKVADETLPSNTLMARWAESEPR